MVRPRRVKILDATKAPNGGIHSFDLNKHGFCTIPVPPFNAHGKGWIRSEYLPLLEEVAKEATGAQSAFAFTHSLRREDRGREYGSNYARFVHADYGASSPPTMRQMLKERFKVPEAQLDQLEVCIVNIWHPIDRPAFKDPLCLLDATSIAPGSEAADNPKLPFNIDFILSGLRDGDRDGLERYYKQAYFGEGNRFDPNLGPNDSSLGVCATYDPGHRFYYCPDMRPDQGWLFKQWDSREGIGARQSFHTAFEDPFHEGRDDLPDRRSLECRLVLTFPKSPASKI